MRIAHVSDIHIRNFKYRDEYRTAFDDLYEKLEVLAPDLIINTGDTVHSKLAVSPELFDDVSWHMRKMSDIAPYWLILGNHDLNLKNRGRMNAIYPIVAALRGSTVNEVELLGPEKRSGLNVGSIDFMFWNYDIRGHEVFDVNSAYVNVGLFHGSVAGCVTDLGHSLEECETEVSKFDDMDYVMLGDIHKRQSFRDGRVRYPGSLIQQNYGEELVKGFLLWDIRSKDEFSVDFHPVTAPGRFYTIQVPSNLDISTIDVPQESRIKAMVTGELTPSKRWELEKRLREKFSPLEIITPDPSANLTATAMKIDDLVGSREELARVFLRDRGCDPAAVEEVMNLFRKYESTLDDDDSPRGTTWQLNKISWDNMMNYGEENVIDLTKIGGLVGIFAPNASGKSSIFDILLQALFDKISKDVPRNIDLVNDNKDSGKMSVSLESNGKAYMIERVIERIQYGQRKLPETKQWGKTSLDLSENDESVTETSRPETERAIRQIIGSFEDFVLTTMLSQHPISGLPGGADVLNCRETDRRKILFRFLDLDSYERIHSAARDDLKGLMGGLKADREKLAARSAEALKGREKVETMISAQRSLMTAKTAEFLILRDKIRSIENVDRAAQDLQEAKDSVSELKNMVCRDRISLEDFLEAEKIALVQRDIHISTKPIDPDLSLEDIAERAVQIEGKLVADRGSLSARSSQKKQGERSLSTLEDIPCEGKFPTCRFISDALNFIDQRSVIEAAIDELTASVAVSEDDRKRLEEHRIVHRKIQEWDRKLGEIELALARTSDRVASAKLTVESGTRLLKAAEERLSTARALVDITSVEKFQELQKQEKDASEAIQEHQFQLDGMMKALGATLADESAAAAELMNYDTLKDKALIHERLVELCGKNGLPYRILSLVLPVINSEISKILSGIVRFSVFFEDDPEEQSVSLSIRYGDYKSRPLSLGSGAEKFIASLAIRAALLNVSSLPKTDILIIDEGFGKLDPEHLESVNRIFEYLRGSFKTIFLVSHVDSMRDIVDHSIDIISRAGYAHVDVS